MLTVEIRLCQQGLIKAWSSLCWYFGTEVEKRTGNNWNFFLYRIWKHVQFAWRSARSSRRCRPRCPVGSHPPNLQDAAEYCRQDLSKTFLFLAFFWNVSLKWQTIPTPEAVKRHFWKKPGKYPTTKETWRKYNASRKLQLQHVLRAISNIETKDISYWEIKPLQRCTLINSHPSQRTKYQQARIDPQIKNKEIWKLDKRREISWA